MSWGVSVVGKPEKVCVYLDEYSAGLTGQSKEEFDVAKVHLQGLVRMAAGEDALISLNANGHANFEPGTKNMTYGSINVKLEHSYTKLVL